MNNSEGGSPCRHTTLRLLLPICMQCSIAVQVTMPGLDLGQQADALRIKAVGHAMHVKGAGP